VSDPRPILYYGGLINPPDASVDALAVSGEVRSAGDLPFAGLVGEAVSDLKIRREDVIGEQSDLSPSMELGPAGRAADRGLPQGGSERVECSFGLSDQHIRVVSRLLTLLDQVACRFARHLRAASHLRWEHRAAVEVRPDAVGQVRVTPSAFVRTDAEGISGSHIAQVELSSAANALGD